MTNKKAPTKTAGAFIIARAIYLCEHTHPGLSGHVVTLFDELAKT
jgi:hypothetical protein